MRGVAGVWKAGAVGGARGRTRSAASGFSLDGLGSAGSAAAETAAASATAAVGLSLLAMQENGGRTGGTRRRGGASPPSWTSCRASRPTSWAGGRTRPARLARLAALQSREEGADPAVRTIGLRARIELALRGLDPQADRSATVA